MQYSVYSLSVVYTLYGLLFPFKMNSKCSRRSHLEHPKYSKTIMRSGLRYGPHRGSLQRSPKPSSWWGLGSLPLLKNPTLASALRGSGCGPSGLANPFLNYLPTSRYPPTPMVFNLISFRQSSNRPIQTAGHILMYHTCVTYKLFRIYVAHTVTELVSLPSAVTPIAYSACD